VRFRVAQPYGLSNAQSPFRVTDDTGREVPWVNRFLDRQRVRSVADSTLRGYAHDLLHFLRWWVGVNQTEAIAEKALTASTLLDYIRFQTNLWRIRGKTASGRICFNDGAAARVALS
jgi:hypothetical protein